MTFQLHGSAVHMLHKQSTEIDVREEKAKNRMALTDELLLK